MPVNKNQHFVPRCHFRPFTTGSANSSINLFNIHKRKIIPNASVKHQCSRDYFYGTDEKLESAIQLIEKGYGRTMAELGRNNYKFTDSQSAILKTFWLFQHFRTEAVALHFVQMNNATKEIADLPAKEFSLKIKDAVFMGCRMFVESMHEIDDLHFCLVKNWTKIPFVTSDNPAVLANRWVIDKNKDKEFTFGIGSAGAIVVLPLSPRLLLLGYDSEVYSVFNADNITEIRNDRDVIAFNQHQYLNCVANIYLHDTKYGNLLLDHYLDIESNRLTDRFVVRLAQIDYTYNEYSRYTVISPEMRDKTKEAIIHSRSLFPIPKTWPSVIRMQDNGSVYTNGSAAGYVRLSRAVHGSGESFWRERA
jgi:hypothetical protein